MINTKLGIKGVKYKLYIKKAGEKEWSFRYKGENLIMDSGLDAWCDTDGSGYLTQQCQAGTGNSIPLKRDSGVITFTRAGNVVTASASFFEAGDVGRIIKLDSGEEDQIITFNSVTEVITATSGAWASSEGSIHYVDQTALETFVKSTVAYGVDGGDNGTSVVSNVVTHKRTHIFSAEVGSVTYNELGWRKTSGDLFSRSLISGGISLVALDQLKVVSELDIVISTTTSTAVSDVGTGFNSAGNAQVEHHGMTSVAANGQPDSVVADGFGLGEPSARFDVAIHTADIAFQTFPASGFEIDPGEPKVITNPESYTPGTFYRDFITVFGTSVFNKTGVVTLMWGTDPGGGNEINPIYRIRLTSSFNKTSSDILTLNLRTTVGRLLVN